MTTFCSPRRILYRITKLPLACSHALQKRKRDRQVDEFPFSVLHLATVIFLSRGPTVSAVLYTTVASDVACRTRAVQSAKAKDPSPLDCSSEQDASLRSI